MALRIAFSLDYCELSAGIGAPILFATDEATMIGWALTRGERLRTIGCAGHNSALCGLAWGGYVAPALLVALLASGKRVATPVGVGLAILSGAVASALGYVAWYAALRGLRATSAATVQLVVPVLAAMGGVALLGELVTWRLAGSSVLILGGVWLTLVRGVGGGADRPGSTASSETSSTP